MSSTITTGKSAAAFQTKEGKIVYVLSEKMHESNVFPQTPRWSCCAVGEYADVMRWVFSGAACCEGGGLQGSGRRHIKPENYIAAWRRELAEPVLLPDKTIRLTVGTGIYDPVPKENLEDVSKALAAIGRDDVIQQLQTGVAEISLYNDAEVLLALYRLGGIIGCPWKVLKHSEYLTLRNPELGIQPALNPVTRPTFKVAKINEYDLLVQMNDGTWENWHWPYSAVGRFIRDFALPIEMQRTGAAKDLIGAFRDACETAKPLSPDTALTFTQGSEDAEGISKWNIEAFDKLAQELGIAEGQAEFECTLATIQENKGEAMYHFGHLHNSQVVWSVPIAEPEMQQPVKQLSLIAA